MTYHTSDAMKTLKHNLKYISSQFAILGDFVSAEPYGTGHINDTYASTFDQGGTAIRYIHQRINHNVFKKPAIVMENIERVLIHLHGKTADGAFTDLHRRVLTLVPSRTGASFVRDPEGNTWRTYIFIEKASTYDVIETPQMAYHAAKAFGEFQKLLADIPGERLHETIPGFHDTPQRFNTLKEAIKADAMNRAKDAKAEIDFASGYEKNVGLLIEAQKNGRIPERITHNDTKLNNVMLDDKTGEGICVIDLDTVMPGLTLYDFGDMVRTATRSGTEDERDLSKITFKHEMFDALSHGYLETAGGFLNEAEKEFLAFSGQLITFEIGIRFLTDFLQGDVYFKIHRPGQNLDRCRTQFKMAQEMIRYRDDMEKTVRKYR